MYPPWESALLVVDDHIVDHDEKSHKSGWGPAVCRLVDPNGATLSGVWYDDGSEDTIPRSNAWRVLNPGDCFDHHFDGHGTVKMRVRRYTGKNRVIATEFNEIDEAELKTRNTRSKRRPLEPDTGKDKRMFDSVFVLFVFFLLTLCPLFGTGRKVQPEKRKPVDSSESEASSESDFEPVRRSKKKSPPKYKTVLRKKQGITTGGMRPIRPCKVALNYMWTHPETDEPHETGFLVPGPAWDTIRKEQVFVIHFDPLDHNYLLLDHTEVPRRSRTHIRACREEEREKVNDTKYRVVNLRNICPWYVNTPSYKDFMKFHKKAIVLRKAMNSEWIEMQIKANECFKKNCLMTDRGFRNINLTMVHGARILEPDGRSEPLPKASTKSIPGMCFLTVQSFLINYTCISF